MKRTGTPLFLLLALLNAAGACVPPHTTELVTRGVQFTSPIHYAPVHAPLLGIPASSQPCPTMKEGAL
jgi:hypothetical protein